MYPLEINDCMSMTVIDQIEDICKEYGLYAKIVDHTDAYYAYESGVYIVVSIAPIAEDVNTYKLNLRNERRKDLFYLKDLSILLTESNAMVVLSKIIDFCKKSALVRALCHEFDVALMETIPRSLCNTIIALNAGRFDETVDASYRAFCEEKLKQYFATQKKPERNNKQKKENDILVSLQDLFSYTDKISKLEVAEELYEPLLKYLKTSNPEVVLFADEKVVLDTGYSAKKRLQKHSDNGIRYVTSAELYETLRLHFETEGFRCIEDMEACYWEYRYVYYRTVDAPYVLAAYQALCFEFAQADSLFYLKERGSICKIMLPVTLLYDFVSLAKNNQVMFYIDNQCIYSAPSETDVMILFNKCDMTKMDEIIDYLIYQLERTSHLLYEQQLKYAPCI